MAYAHFGEPDEPGWSTTAELAGPRLDDALQYAGASLRTDRPDIQGQRLVELVTWELAVAGATALLEHDALPDLSPDNVLLWIGDAPPGELGITLRHDGSEPPDPARLRGVVTEHLAPLVDAVNLATRRPRRALWRGVSDRLAAAIVWIGETTGNRDRGCELARAAAEAPLELRLFKAGEYELLLHVREGCCLYYRVPGGTKCFSCPLLGDDERRALVAAG